MRKIGRPSNRYSGPAKVDISGVEMDMRNVKEKGGWVIPD